MGAQVPQRLLLEVRGGRKHMQRYEVSKSDCVLGLLRFQFLKVELALGLNGLCARAGDRLMGLLQFVLRSFLAFFKRRQFGTQFLGFERGLSLGHFRQALWSAASQTQARVDEPLALEVVGQGRAGAISLFGVDDHDRAFVIHRNLEPIRTHRSMPFFVETIEIPMNTFLGIGGA
ncbi:hypothetical protein D3C85_604580 [compost metagenome]